MLRLENNPIVDAAKWAPGKAMDKQWQNFRKAMERHGGLPAVADLIGDLEFPNILKRVDMEQCLASHIFGTAWQINKNGLPVVKEKLFRLIEESVRRGAYKDLEGKPLELPASRNSLYKAWKRHSAVAHWVAAYYVLHALCDEDSPRSSSESLVPYFQKDPIALGTFADHFLGVASQIEVRTQKGRLQPFLDPKKAWQLPPSFPIHKSNAHKQLYFRFPTLEDWELDILGIS